MTTTHDKDIDTTKQTWRYTDFPSPLALSPDVYRRTTQMASEIAAAYYETRGQQPVYTPPPPETLQSLRTLHLPEQGMSAEDILAFFAKSIMPYDMGNQVETFSAWVNPAAAPISSLLDYLASVMNPTAAKGLHAATEVERLVIRWLDELIGFPTEAQGSGGIFVNGGSLANFHGLAAALHWAGTLYDWDTVQQGVQGRHPRFMLYGSREVHSCVSKAVHTLGLGLHAYQRIATDGSYRLDLNALKAAIEADREAGLWPFAVVASAGTVNTGAVDPLPAMADLCERQGPVVVWDASTARQAVIEVCNDHPDAEFWLRGQQGFHAPATSHCSALLREEVDPQVNCFTFCMQKERTTMQTQPGPGSLADLHQRFHGDAPGLREHYRTLQAQCPVLYDQAAGCWLVLRCHDAESVLTDPATFASARSGASPRRPPGSVAGIVGQQFLFLDGPQHLAVQEVLRKPLGRMASQLGPFLQETIAALLERGRRDGRLDLVGGFAAPLSRLLIARVLGVPTRDAAFLVQLERWSDAFADVTSGHLQTDLGGVLSLYDYFERLTVEKRRHPDDDLLSVYVAAADQGLRDPEEVVSDAMMLFAAGRVTLRTLLPTVLWHLLSQDPDNLAVLQRALRARPGLLSTLTEEALRWGTPTTRVARWTTHAVALSGQLIPAGEKVCALLEAANVDERCFPAATRFEPVRRPNRHYTFGAGPHACTGAPVARKAAQAAFAALLVLPGLALESPEVPPLYANENIGGIRTCMVVL